MEMVKEMLSYQRGFCSNYEYEFIKRFIDAVSGMAADEFGNRYLRVGDQPATLFSAHTDTVQVENRICEISVDEEYKIFYRKDDQPLGADDGTGCWILLQLIAAGYVRIPC